MEKGGGTFSSLLQAKRKTLDQNYLSVWNQA